MFSAIWPGSLSPSFGPEELLEPELFESSESEESLSSELEESSSAL